MTRRQNFEARPDNPDAIRGLKVPEMPESLRYIWVWWGELQNARRVGPHGLDPITYVDVQAWARLMDRRPTSYEVDALMRLDRAMLTAGDA